MERDSYTSGTPSWVDLGSPDVDASVAFYTTLFGWEVAEDHPAAGGLESEQEDLRLHVLPFEQAIGLVTTGEANAMPTISMLLWLDRWRAGRR